MHLIDSTVLHTIGAYTVFAEHNQVLFKDGSTIGLHLVHHHGHPAMFLRAFVHDDLHALVFDLRASARALAAEMLLLHERDIPGLVLFTLRAKYEGKAEFAAAAMANLIAAKLLDMPTRQQQIAFSTGEAEFFNPEAQDRRFWPVHVDGRAFA